RFPRRGEILMSETDITLLDQSSLDVSNEFLESFEQSPWRTAFLGQVTAHLTALLEACGDDGVYVQAINQVNDIRVLHKGKVIKIVDDTLVFEDGHQVEISTILQIAT